MPLKFVYQDEIRRVTETPANYLALLMLVKQLFGDALPSKFSLHYEDYEGDRVVLGSNEDFETMLATELSEDNKCIKIHLTGATEDSISIIAKDVIQSESEKGAEEDADEPEPNYSPIIIDKNPQEIQESCPARTVENDHRDEEAKEEEDETQSATQLIETAEKNSDSVIISRKDTSSQVDLVKEIELSEALPEKVLNDSSFQNTISSTQAEQMKAFAKEAFLENIPQLAKLVKEMIKKPKAEAQKLPKDKAPSKKASKSAAKVIHEGVVCDMCKMDPIVGIRYKCSVTNDFDLCEACEEKGTHPYPMLKIRTHAQVPYKIVTDVSKGVMIELKSKQKTSKSAKGKKPSKTQDTAECPVVGQTEKVTKSAKKGELTKKKEGADKTKTTKAEKKPKSEKLCKQVAVGKLRFDMNYSFEMIAEVSQIPNVVTESAYIVYKTITLKNTGSDAWPKNAFVKCIDDELAGEPTALTDILPGKQINAILAMKSPEKTGKYAYNWQLCYNDAKKKEVRFGKPFKLEFQVEESNNEGQEELKIQDQIKLDSKYTDAVLRTASALKELFHDKHFDEICEYVAKYPQMNLEDLIELYLQHA